MKSKKSIYLILHIMLFGYSVSGIMSKLASTEPFLSSKFIIYYCIEIAVLLVYAIGWQQILKKLSLSVAYANKAVNVVWNCFWGLLLFNESLTLNKVIGIIMVILGICIYAFAEE